MFCIIVEWQGNVIDLHNIDKSNNYDNLSTFYNIRVNIVTLNDENIMIFKTNVNMKKVICLSIVIWQ